MSTLHLYSTKSRTWKIVRSMWGIPELAFPGMMEAEGRLDRSI